MRYGYRSVTPYAILIYCAMHPGLHTVDELCELMFVNVARKYVRLLSNEGALTLFTRLQGYRYGFVDCSPYHECRQYRYDALRRRIMEIMPLMDKIVEIVVMKKMPRERRLRKIMAQERLDQVELGFQNEVKRGGSPDSE